jgi:primosomal protein N' (replication factor Y)
VTLVGVIAAESSLWFPDFRATERTFQLLTQVAGRAGRGDIAGVVLIQTHDPDNPCFARVRAHDDAGFYAEELAHRREPRWPPFCRLVNFRISAATAEAAEEAAQRCARAARDLARKDAAIEVLGPAPAVIPRLRNRWRWQVLLKGDAPGTLRRVARAVLGQVGRRAGRGGATLAVDVDPGGMI